MKLIYYIILLLGLTTVPEISKQRLAVREVAEKAATGDGKALYDLAMLHDMGYDSIPVDSVRSTILYRLSAEAGYAPAQNYLGFRYFNGEAVRQDVDSALYWMAKAAGNGDAKAANNLGYLLANSEKVTRDYPQAIYWLTKAADAGLPAGMSQLADLYRMGKGCTPDTARAEALYTRAIQSGLHDAELKLLAMKGNQWLKLSPDSALTLGKYHYTHGAPLLAITLFENIINTPNSSDYTELTTAESSNNTLGNSQNQVIPPQEQCGHPQNQAGISHNQVNSQQNNVLNSSQTKEEGAVAKALALLGDAYSRGQGVEYDHDRSIQLFYEAALRGEPSAEFVIAELLDIFPDAVTFENPEKNNAAYWYDRAAAQGITDAATATTRLLE